MHQIVARLDALDPDAGAAVRVIARFDELIEGRAGLEPILSAVAVLTGCPARMIDDRFGIKIRSDESGQVEHCSNPPDPRWLTAPLAAGGGPAFWLERIGVHTLLDAMVLDRAAFAAREVLHRTRSASRVVQSIDDPAAVEVLLDSSAREDDRLHAARLLRLPANASLRAVARPGRVGQVEIADGTAPHKWDGLGRTGVGPAVPLLELPKSWAQARTALRFAADGTDDDPGPAVVLAEEVGALLLLAEAFDPTTPPTDVRAIEGAAKSAPWVLRTLVEFTAHNSLRLAAAALFVHHSTLQDRLTTIEHDLGWSVRDPQGRLRVQLALAARRLLLHPTAAHPV